MQITIIDEFNFCLYNPIINGANIITVSNAIIYLKIEKSIVKPIYEYNGVIILIYIVSSNNLYKITIIKSYIKLGRLYKLSHFLNNATNRKSVL